MRKLITILALCSLIACSKESTKSICWTCNTTKAITYGTDTTPHYYYGKFDTCDIQEVQAKEVAASFSYGWRQTSKRGDKEMQTCTCSPK